jgi:general secretion pathway protein N
MRRNRRSIALSRIDCAMALACAAVVCAGGAAAAGAPSLIGNPLSAVSLDTLSATRERPVFSPTRRPATAAVAAAAPVMPAAKVAAPEPAEPDHPPLTLVGTIIGGSTRIGIFREQSNQNVIQLRAGDNFGGWQLLAVRGRETDFEKARQVAVLSLPPRDALPASGPGVPAVSAPSAPAHYQDARGMASDRAERR